ncbi:hypothetical protein A3H87_04340 [Candidatus Curtissbacteria bacterium RIFCSPLOWO2_02_FULL_42_37]|uniref:Uncharacterized protein n=1 Tax=Candidatus Curtissbacteria bacterium RIFCSPLOWO2_01_FULL_42_50 TaxID=1797730 RepID=A0A1F5H8I9_9BACT|nr:MAG: hypothetical protein A3C33_04765 [Candidatus Curtissbacteria bacterium RIFCSPHIGHO2_02_FULL_42_58]OGE00355.1 MAG: hypothetical protein A3B54_01440 [Candidatus Curtissbacteria bacterium RIFCSPLOWO2_01_FULL_42_50]OGE03816.1 MAG: hypothetical protein A3G16_05070 [Candidatus Curtissbacteria bacterium RIFCSPLOWO2_12_FULL_41_16]OGE10215.1 MAG: hypothetical protein A3H87_04340 [Candidatus Curtissbacteria bacterium RIFCSPLOWO2_02_FULL_42_37]
MKRLLTRVGVGVTAASMFAAAFAPAAAFANGGGNSCEIKNNGAFSRNRCRITEINVQVTRQNNRASIWNGVLVIANTGGNEANGNTGGNVDVDSGNATVNVRITNTVNQDNTAN